MEIQLSSSIITRALRHLFVTLPDRFQQRHPTDKLLHAFVAAWIVTLFEFDPFWATLGFFVAVLINHVRERLSEQPDRADTIYAGFGALFELVRYWIAFALFGFF